MADERVRLIPKLDANWMTDERGQLVRTMQEDVVKAFDEMFVSNAIDTITVMGMGNLHPAGHAAFEGEGKINAFTLDNEFSNSPADIEKMKQIILAMIVHAHISFHATLMPTRVVLTYNRLKQLVLMQVSFIVPLDTSPTT